MPNLFKRFTSRAKAEPYRFPDASELMREEEKPPKVKEEALWTPEDFGAPEGTEQPGTEQPPPAEAGTGAGAGAEAAVAGTGAGAGAGAEAAVAGAGTGDSPGGKPEEKPEENPVKFAQIQADKLLREARVQADKILDKARLDAALEAGRIQVEAREAGRQEGYAQGLAQGNLEAKQAQEERAAAWEAEVAKFLERAGSEVDRQLDDNVEELRDLAMAIAEKVVGISLKSSSDVICRMIQNAIDKKKRREWVHIYISECDAKGLGQIPASLSSALTALSGRVRLIPIADDEPGTCIIETPDEIIDASAATQLNNIRSLLMDTASSGDGGGFYL